MDVCRRLLPVLVDGEEGHPDTYIVEAAACAAANEARCGWTWHRDRAHAALPQERAQVALVGRRVVNATQRPTIVERDIVEGDAGGR